MMLFKTVVNGSAFCLQWNGSNHCWRLSRILQRGGKQGRVAIVTAADVPPETHLADQTFAPAGQGSNYTSPHTEHDAWSSPGPVRHGPLRAYLSDGSSLMYAWYRFVDQPALQSLGLSGSQKAKLQRFVERLHAARWKITGDGICLRQPAAFSLR